MSCCRVTRWARGEGTTSSLPVPYARTCFAISPHTLAHSAQRRRRHHALLLLQVRGKNRKGKGKDRSNGYESVVISRSSRWLSPHPAPPSLSEQIIRNDISSAASACPARMPGRRTEKQPAGPTGDAAVSNQAGRLSQQPPGAERGGARTQRRPGGGLPRPPAEGGAPRTRSHGQDPQEVPGVVIGETRRAGAVGAGTRTQPGTAARRCSDTAPAARRGSLGLRPRAGAGTQLELEPEPKKREPELQMPKSMLVLVLVLVIMLVFVYVFVSVLVSVSVSVFGTGASWRRGFERWILAAPGGCGMQHWKCRRWSQTERPGTARVARPGSHGLGGGQTRPAGARGPADVP